MKKATSVEQIVFFITDIHFLNLVRLFGVDFHWIKRRKKCKRIKIIKKVENLS